MSNEINLLPQTWLEINVANCLERLLECLNCLEAPLIFATVLETNTIYLGNLSASPSPKRLKTTETFITLSPGLQS